MTDVIPYVSRLFIHLISVAHILAATMQKIELEEQS